MTTHTHDKRMTGMARGILGICLALAATGAPAEPEKRRQASEQQWQQNIRPAAFGERPILEGAPDFIKIKAPARAEDPAVVPIRIHGGEFTEDAPHVEKIHVYIDQNPVPLVGSFTLSPASGRGDLAMRVRVDDFSYIRAIAEMSDGSLYMDKTYIRSVGGCSAPPGASVENSIANLGKTRLGVVGELRLNEPNLVQLKISHPNVTGMALDQRTNSKPPAYFIREFEVSYQDQPVLHGELTFAISQDPSFRFFFVPEQPGMLKVRSIDTKQKEFVFEQPLELALSER